MDSVLALLGYIGGIAGILGIGFWMIQQAEKEFGRVAKDKGKRDDSRDDPKDEGRIRKEHKEETQGLTAYCPTCKVWYKPSSSAHDGH